MKGRESQALHEDNRRKHTPAIGCRTLDVLHVATLARAAGLKIVVMPVYQTMASPAHRALLATQWLMLK